MGSKINTVIVLMPNGRRQTLKVNTDSSIFQILEEVCEKNDFSTNDFALRHHSTVLDPGTVLRFSALPNNAFLEMVPNKKSSLTNEKVTISIQIDGQSERLTGEFSSSSDLKSVLLQLAPNVISDNVGKVPVVVYMRREVVGLDALNSTSLRSLGLTSGRALLRVTFRDTEEHPELQCSGVSVLTAPKKEEPKTVAPPITRTFVPFSPETKRRSTFESQPIPAAEIVTAFEVVHDVMETVSKDPTTSYQKDNTPNAYETCGKGNKSSKKCEKAPTCRIVASVPMEVDAVESRNSIELDNLKYLDKRNGLVFRLQNANVSFSQELPESFFDVTVEDVRLLMRDLKRTRETLENAPLQTESFRRVQRESKVKLYSTTIIRIQFPNRLVLQGVFSSTETVNDVISFVKYYLQNPEEEFYLYTSPPKTVLSAGDDLIRVGCVPCAKVYFAYTQNVESDKFLRENVMSSMTTQDVASLAACKFRGLKRCYKDNYQGESSNEIETQSHTADFPHPVTQHGGNAPNDRVAKPVDHPRSHSEGSKLPKWFKP